MSLTERDLPVFKRQDSFFDHLFDGMDDMDHTDDMRSIRSRMFHLVPFCDDDVTATTMDVCIVV